MLSFKENTMNVSRRTHDILPRITNKVISCLPHFSPQGEDSEREQTLVGLISDPASPLIIKSLLIARVVGRARLRGDSFGFGPKSGILCV